MVRHGLWLWVVVDHHQGLFRIVSFVIVYFAGFQLVVKIAVLAHRTINERHHGDVEASVTFVFLVDSETYCLQAHLVDKNPIKAYTVTKTDESSYPVRIKHCFG